MFKPEEYKYEIVRENMEECGKGGTLYACTKSGTHLAWVPSSCDIWGCPRCEKHRKGKILKRLMPRLQNAIRQRNGHRKYPLKFVTLTLPFFVDPRMVEVEKYHKKACTFLKGLYEGGLVVSEFKPRENNKIFLHFHAIVEGGYVAQADIQDGWSGVVGQRAIVHVQKANEKALGYIVKYLVKGPEGFSEEETVNTAAAFYKRQRCRSFGTLRKSYESEPRYPMCPTCGSPMEVLSHTSAAWVGYYYEHESELLSGLGPPHWATEDEFNAWTKRHAGPYADQEAFLATLYHQTRLSSYEIVWMHVLNKRR